MKNLSPRRLLFETVPLLLFLTILCVEAFGPRPIGLADNGDFPKVLAYWRIWIAPEFQADHKYFVTDYRTGGRFWNSNVPTIELGLVRAAKFLARLFLPTGYFDIRLMGVVHVSIAALAFWLMLRALRPFGTFARLLLTGAFVLIFSDIAVVAFLNTAYMDAGSIVFLMLLFAVALNIALDRRQTDWRWALAFAIAAACFLGTKLQHEPCLVWLMLFAVVMARRAPTLLDKTAWLTLPIPVIAIAAVMVLETPQDYRAYSAFNAAFTKMLPYSGDAPAALQELGRPPTDLAYLGMHAFQPQAPAFGDEYWNVFLRDVTVRKFLGFYLHHPAVTKKILLLDLKDYAARLPLGDTGTMRKRDNPEPFAKPEGLQFWSYAHSYTMYRWPLYLVNFYAIAMLGAIVIPLAKLDAPAWPMCLMLGGMGVFAFLVASLGDAVDTARHLIAFRLLTDMLILAVCIAVFQLCGSAYRSAARKSQTFTDHPPQ